MKKFLVNGEICNFDIIQTCKLHGEHEGEICYYAQCLENGKYAWLDECNGVQFEGEDRVIAEPYAQPSVETRYSRFVPIGCHYWGGEIRNNEAWRKQW